MAVAHAASATIDLSISYQYDVFGQRIDQSVDADGVGSNPAVVTRFAYANAQHDLADVWADLDGTGSLTTRRVFGDGIDQPLARLAGSTVHWYLADRQGSIRELANNTTGALVYQATYGGFGNIESEPLGTTERDRYGYTAREFEHLAGLGHFRARTYFVSLGRFNSEDPITFAAGDANLYRYVGNGPTNGTDPSGQYIFIEREHQDAWKQWLDSAGIAHSFHLMWLPDKKPVFQLHILENQRERFRQAVSRFAERWGNAMTQAPTSRFHVLGGKDLMIVPVSIGKEQVEEVLANIFEAEGHGTFGRGTTRAQETRRIIGAGIRGAADTWPVQYSLAFAENAFELGVGGAISTWGCFKAAFDTTVYTVSGILDFGQIFVHQVSVITDSWFETGVYEPTYLTANQQNPLIQLRTDLQQVPRAFAEAWDELLKGNTKPVARLAGALLTPVIVIPKLISWVKGKIAPRTYPHDFVGPIEQGAVRAPAPKTYPHDFVGPMEQGAIHAPVPINRFGVAGDSTHRQTGIKFNGSTARELQLADIEPLHPVPRDVKPAGYIDDLAAHLKAEGFDRAKFTTDVLRMPDGHLRMANGNHRAEAMKRLNETTVPGRVLDWKDVPPQVQKWFRERLPDLDWPTTD